MMAKPSIAVPVQQTPSLKTALRHPIKTWQQRKSQHKANAEAIAAARELARKNGHNAYVNPVTDRWEFLPELKVTTVAPGALGQPPHTVPTITRLKNAATTSWQKVTMTASGTASRLLRDAVALLPRPAYFAEDRSKPPYTLAPPRKPNSPYVLNTHGKVLTDDHLKAILSGVPLGQKIRVTVANNRKGLTYQVRGVNGIKRLIPDGFDDLSTLPLLPVGETDGEEVAHDQQFTSTLSQILTPHEKGRRGNLAIEERSRVIKVEALPPHLVMLSLLQKGSSTPTSQEIAVLKDIKDHPESDLTLFLGLSPDTASERARNAFIVYSSNDRKDVAIPKMFKALYGRPPTKLELTIASVVDHSTFNIYGLGGVKVKDWERRTR